MATLGNLSEELSWRGFVNQTTYKDASVLDDSPITFYWGVDPSADSMTVGNLAIAMMVRHFIDHGHKAILLVGGATGLIGDPDGKSQERELLTSEQIAQNKAAISEQYRRVFAGQDFEIVDNYDWFQNMNYLDFLRTVGKHVPVRQMIGRDFVQSRLGEQGSGISYAEFSYSLIQGYDFLHLYQDKGVTLQVCGADQWGNCIAGVDLIRRVTGGEAHIWSAPLIVNKSTGVKFGKSEDGAVWLDAVKTSPNDFYQFWINADDAGVEDYLKIYTLLSADEIQQVMSEFNADKPGRAAQKRLAHEVTYLVHGEEAAVAAEAFAAGLQNVNVQQVAATVTAAGGEQIVDTLAESGLASSKSEARQLLADGGVYINDQHVNRDTFVPEDFHDGQLVLRRGKKLQNSVVVRLQS
jgi:tyrosyl-tRNA synthetase